METKTYQEGYDEGYEDGCDDCECSFDYDEGYDQGHSEGYKNGVTVTLSLLATYNGQPLTTEIINEIEGKV